MVLVSVCLCAMEEGGRFFLQDARKVEPAQHSAPPHVSSKKKKEKDKKTEMQGDMNKD